MVETIRLESGHTLTGIVGSNPTLSAILSSDCDHPLSKLGLGDTAPGRLLSSLKSQADAATDAALNNQWRNDFRRKDFAGNSRRQRNGDSRATGLPAKSVVGSYRMPRFHHRSPAGSVCASGVALLSCCGFSFAIRSEKESGREKLPARFRRKCCNSFISNKAISVLPYRPSSRKIKSQSLPVCRGMPLRPTGRLPSTGVPAGSARP